MRRRLQNRIAESTLTLPLAAVVATLLWWLPQGGYTAMALRSWAATAAVAYFVIECTTANALLRTRSQMVAALLLLLLAVGGYLHTHFAALLAMLALIVAHHCLLQTAPRSASADDIASSRGFAGRTSRPYQRPQVATLHAYTAISLGSLAWPPLLLFAMPLLWSQAIYLRSITWRCLGAAVIGLALPYFFWGTAALFAASLQTPETAPTAYPQLSLNAFTEACAAIVAPVAEPVRVAMDGAFPVPEPYAQWADAEAVGAWAAARVPRLSLLALVALLALTGFVHYVRSSYDDKIRVRISHYTFLTTMVVAALWLALQPRHFDFLFPLFMLGMAPSAAHFMALTRTWLTNAWVVVLALALVAVGVVNLVPDIGAYVALAMGSVGQLL